MGIRQWGYIVVLFIPALTQLTVKLSQHAGGLTSRYSALLLTAILVLGYVANERQQPLFTRWFWRSYLWLLCALLAGVVLFAGYILLLGVWWQALMLLVASGLFIPALLSLHCYSSFNNRVWHVR